MASFHDNHESFSTSELFQNDETARAPELSPVPTVIATEFLSVPETLPGTDPEVHYNTLAPEVVNVSDALGQPRASSLRKSGFLTRKKIYLAALAVGFLALIAIGLGVGLGHPQRIHSSPPATTRPSAGPANTTSPTSPANPVHSSIKQQILDDTSLAAVYTTGGDKHVFFQDPQGVIQQVIQTDGQWIVKTNEVGILDASGIVTALLNTDGLWADISSNHTSEPRSSFSPIWSNDSAGTTGSTLYDLVPRTRLSTPFTPSAANSSDLTVMTLICGDNCSSTLWSNYSSYTNTSHGIFTSISDDEDFAMSNRVANVNNDGYTGSDIAIITGDNPFAVYISGTKPVAVGYGQEPQDAGHSTNAAPFGPFPYTRLASIALDDGQTSYLYHQINGTTIAEEKYIPSENQWYTSSYIIIPGA